MELEPVVAVSEYAVWLLPESGYIYEVMKWRWSGAIAGSRSGPGFAKKPESGLIIGKGVPLILACNNLPEELNLIEKDFGSLGVDSRVRCFRVELNRLGKKLTLYFQNRAALRQERAQVPASVDVKHVSLSARLFCCLNGCWCSGQGEMFEQQASDVTKNIACFFKKLVRNL